MLGEEVGLVRALRAQGLHGVWVPSARVRHHLPARRLTLEYLWEYNLGVGRTAVRLDGIPPGRRIAGIPRWLYTRYARLRCWYHLQRWLGRPRWVETLVRAAHVSGMIRECRALAATRG